MLTLELLRHKDKTAQNKLAMQSRFFSPSGGCMLPLPAIWPAGARRRY